MTEHASERPEPGRIAIYIPSLKQGGVAKSMLTLAAGLAERGIAVDLLVCRAVGELLGQVPDSVELVVLEEASWWTWRRVLLSTLARDPRGLLAILLPIILWPKPARSLISLPALVRYLSRERPDGLIAALTFPNLASLWARRAAGVACGVVVSERMVLSPKVARSRGAKWRLVPSVLRRFYPEAESIATVSRDVAQDLASLTGIDRGRIHTAYNPVVTPDLREKAAAPVDHPWFNDQITPVVLGTGRLTERKDFPTLLRAFARVRAEQPARLVILGEGRARNELESLARELGVSDCVDLPGFMDNPFAFMSRASVFVLSSTSEGSPGVLIQAMACGCPVVSTDCPGGPEEILEAGRYGHLVPVGDDAALAKAILETLRGRPDRESLRRRAAHFSLDRAVDRYLSLLRGKG